MKILFNTKALILLYLPLLISMRCNSEFDNSEFENCLPYEGEVIGVSCIGPAVKVKNKNVNSFFYTLGGKEIYNVVGVKIPIEFVHLLESAATMKRSFYFDCRELRLDEENVCLQAQADPSRKVFMTRFSFISCDSIYENE